MVHSKLKIAAAKRHGAKHEHGREAYGAGVESSRRLIINSIPASIPAMRELIREGLRQRQEHGVAAALPYFEKAALLDPDSHLPFFMLGNAASELGDLDAAVLHLTRARDLQPNEPVVRLNLGLNQLARGFLEPALVELHAACSLNPAYLPAQSAYLLALHNSDRIEPDQIAAATREWGLRVALQHPATTWPRAHPDPSFSPRLRVGFISGDFRLHSVAHFFEPIMEARDRSAFEYVLYSNSQHRDRVTERLQASADDWHEVWQLTDDALITLIGSDRIDILVDLSGHTAFNRLAVFARRAAPVQVTYLGYPDLTGVPTMDYRMTDAITDPAPLADGGRSERLLRLPETQWCFRPFGAPAAPGRLPARDAGFVTFGSFNQLIKISATVLNCWARILIGSPTSRLRLTRVRSPQRAADIVATLGQSGVSAERIDCIANRSDPPHGAQFADVDIALDTYPYNGVTTTCEALYSGLPVISLHGQNCASRSGLSLLGNLGAGDLVATCADKYVDIALTLCGDLSRLEQLRATLRTRFEQSPLRDEMRFANNFEQLLHTAWRQC
jgi:protein O-GlcNAc transferase